MKKTSISVKNIFKLSLDEIVKLRHNVNLRFEDGVVKENINFKHVHIYRYIMDFYTRDTIPKVPLTSDLWLDNFLEEGYFNSDTYLDLYSAYLSRFVNMYLNKSYDSELLRRLLRGFYDSAYLLAHKLMEYIGDYVIDVEIQDIIEVQFNRKLLDSIVDVYKQPSPENVSQSYKVLDDIIRHELSDNNVIRLIYLSKMVNSNQLKQLFGSRGYLTDINSKIYTVPMINSFTLGCRNIYDMAIESRAGAKALWLANKAIPDSEYTARGLQLATMPLERVEYTDCGNREYTDFYVRPKEVDATGKEIYKGDFKNIIGKRYLDEDGNEKIITPNDKHLIGKTIKLRNATKCKFRDKKKICLACIGQVGYAIFPHQNLGHYSSTVITQKLTQNLLSAKHLTFSADARPIVLDKVTQNFFQVKDKDKLLLKKNLLSRKNAILKLHIPQEQVVGFADVLRIKNLRTINIFKVSRLYEIILESETKDKPKFELIKLYNNNRTGIFTQYFWDYLIKKGYEIDDSGNYVVDMEDWDFNKPIIMYEKKEFDYRALGKEFKKLLQQRKYYKKDGKLIAEFTPEILVEKIFALVNSKLSVNIMPIEAMVYPMSGYDPNNKDYDLSRNSSNRQLITMKQAIDYRSAGAWLGWNQLQTKIFHPYNFKPEHKPDHPMDVMFCPDEVIRYVGED